MIKECKWCHKPFEGNAKKLYHSAKCKKNYENSLRSAPKGSGRMKVPAGTVKRPQGLNEKAAAYWDKVAPTVIERGHLNILSEDAFAELCDLHSRLQDINMAINETNRSLLQIDDKWDNKAGVESQSFKESALSDLKRKYSKLYLEYSNKFYLIPLPNRGNYGLRDNGAEKESKDNIFD